MSKFSKLKMESVLHTEKWANIRTLVENLDPSNVGKILRNSMNHHHFFPTIGLFLTEFCVCYCVNMNTKRDRRR